MNITESLEKQNSSSIEFQITFGMKSCSRETEVSYKSAMIISGGLGNSKLFKEFDSWSEIMNSIDVLTCGERFMARLKWQFIHHFTQCILVPPLNSKILIYLLSPFQFCDCNLLLCSLHFVIGMFDASWYVSRGSWTIPNFAGMTSGNLIVNPKNMLAAISLVYSRKMNAPTGVELF